jgi:putative transposase
MSGLISNHGRTRKTERYASKLGNDEAILINNIVSLASHYGRYGYHRITALLRADGWGVNHKGV